MFVPCRPVRHRKPPAPRSAEDDESDEEPAPKSLLGAPPFVGHVLPFVLCLLGLQVAVKGVPHAGHAQSTCAFDCRCVDLLLHPYLCSLQDTNCILAHKPANSVPRSTDDEDSDDDELETPGAQLLRATLSLSTLDDL